MNTSLTIRPYSIRLVDKASVQGMRFLAIKGEITRANHEQLDNGLILQQIPDVSLEIYDGGHFPQRDGEIIGFSQYRRDQLTDHEGEFIAAVHVTTSYFDRVQSVLLSEPRTLLTLKSNFHALSDDKAVWHPGDQRLLEELAYFSDLYDIEDRKPLAEPAAISPSAPALPKESGTLWLQVAIWAGVAALVFNALAS